ncbi:hypothetical protein J6590_003288 [Homalodisca vitripennis]|nr:hypothetical protein J6590_003288 [Homalodisca vitripennis]
MGEGGEVRVKAALGVKNIKAVKAQSKRNVYCSHALSGVWAQFGRPHRAQLAASLRSLRSTLCSHVGNVKHSDSFATSGVRGGRGNHFGADE